MAYADARGKKEQPEEAPNPINAPAPAPSATPTQEEKPQWQKDLEEANKQDQRRIESLEKVGYYDPNWTPPEAPQENNEPAPAPIAPPEPEPEPETEPEPEPQYTVPKEQQLELDQANVWEPHYTFDEETGEATVEEANPVQPSSGWTQEQIDAANNARKRQNNNPAPTPVETVPETNPADYTTPTETIVTQNLAPIAGQGADITVGNKANTGTTQTDDDWNPYAPKFTTKGGYDPYGAFRGYRNNNGTPLSAVQANTTMSDAYDTVAESTYNSRPDVPVLGYTPIGSSSGAGTYPVSTGETASPEEMAETLDQLQQGANEAIADFDEMMADPDIAGIYQSAIDDGVPQDMAIELAQRRYREKQEGVRPFWANESTPVSEVVVPQNPNRYDPASSIDRWEEYNGVNNAANLNASIKNLSIKATNAQIVEDLAYKLADTAGYDPDTMTSTELQPFLDQASEQAELVQETTAEDEANIINNRMNQDREVGARVDGETAAFDLGRADSSGTYPVYGLGEERELGARTAEELANPVNQETTNGNPFYTTDELYAEAEQSARDAGYVEGTGNFDRYVDNYVADARNNAVNNYVQEETERRVQDEYMDRLIEEELKNINYGHYSYDQMTDSQKEQMRRYAEQRVMDRLNPLARATDQEGNLHFNYVLAREGELPDELTIPVRNSDGTMNPAMQEMTSVDYFDENGMALIKNQNGTFSYPDGTPYKGKDIGWKNHYSPEDIMALYVNPNGGHNGEPTWRGMDWINNLSAEEQAGMKQILANFVYGASPDHVGDFGIEMSDLTEEEFERLADMFVKNTPGIEFLLKNGYFGDVELNADGSVRGGQGVKNLVNFFFKDLPEGKKPKGNGNKNGGGYGSSRYRSYGGGGRGGGGGYYRGGGGSTYMPSYTNPYSPRSSSGGGYTRGGGISSSSGGTEISRSAEPNQTNQRQNRVYNIMKNWSF